jgi:hypothetical protein
MDIYTYRYHYIKYHSITKAYGYVKITSLCRLRPGSRGSMYANVVITQQ